MTSVLIRKVGRMDTRDVPYREATWGHKKLLSIAKEKPKLEASETLEISPSIA